MCYVKGTPHAVLLLKKMAQFRQYFHSVRSQWGGTDLKFRAQAGLANGRWHNRQAKGQGKSLGNKPCVAWFALVFLGFCFFPFCPNYFYALQSFNCCRSLRNTAWGSHSQLNTCWLWAFGEWSAAALQSRQPAPVLWKPVGFGPAEEAWLDKTKIAFGEYSHLGVLKQPCPEKL